MKILKNPNKEHKILIIFDDMIADMLSNKKSQPIVTELFIRGIYQKNIRLNFTRYFIIKNSKQTRASKNCINHISDIDFEGFMNLLKMQFNTLFFFSYW